MPLIDDRGRVFGRFNLLDLAIAVVLLGLIPLAYGAYVLFKVPPPVLTSVDPPQIQFAPEFRINVIGDNLRPYMRVSLNDMQGRAFLFRSRTAAEIVFGDVPPGQYDVVLYDFAQERSRLSKALTVTPPPLPTTNVHIAGFLSGVRADQVPRYKAGFVFTQNGASILAAGSPIPDAANVVTGAHTIEIPVPATVRIPVLLRMACNIQTASQTGGVAECRTGTAIFPGAYLNLPIDNGVLSFLVVAVQPPVDPTLIEIETRVDTTPDAARLIAAGDKDLGASQNEFAAGAVVIAPPNTTRAFRLQVPAFRTLSGWQYAGQIVRVGGPLLFVTPRYQVSTTVVSAPPLPPLPATR